MISPATIEAIKEATRLPDLVAEYTRLQRTAGGFICKCVFHSEKTASLRIHATGDRKDSFKCFGCGVSGNVFGFIMQIEGYSFVQAAEYLAERAGIAVHQGSRRSQIHRLEAAEDRACSKWWWQERWNHSRNLLDEASGSEPPAITIAWLDDGTSKVTGAPIPDDYAFADCLGRILRWIETLPVLEKMNIFRATVRTYEREQWRALVAEAKAFAAVWMSLAEEAMA